jgi:hypothetical protein
VKSESTSHFKTPTLTHATAKRKMIEQRRIVASLLFKIDGYRRMDASTLGHSPQNKQGTAVENKD